MKNKITNIKLTVKYLSVIFLIQSYANAQVIPDSLDIDGTTRIYEVHLPQNFKDDMPLVIALPGYSEDIDEFKAYTRLHQFANTSGFIVVYAEGTNLSWNIGIKYCPIRRYLPTTDDVGFISALIDTLYNRYTIDMKRIYCSGFSTGGEMALRLACQLGERFAAVASVAGGLYDPAENWHPIKPMPVLEIHGTKDLYSPYDGPGGIADTVFEHSAEEWSIKKTLDYWIEKNQCSLEGDTIDLPDLVPGDLCTVQKITFSDCSDSTEVIHYKINEGGHTWPGSPTPWPQWELEGNRNMDISTNEQIWNFFKNYSNPLADMAVGKTIEVYPKYIQPQGDTLWVTGKVSNPQNHLLKVLVMIQGKNSAFQDSFQLYDDGLHGDEGPNDNIWGGVKWFSGLEEDMYITNLSTNDITEGITHYIHYPVRFTTNGPVVIDLFYATGNDTIANPGDQYIKFEIFLRNESATDTIHNITTWPVFLDSSASMAGRGSPKYSFIAPGESKKGNRKLGINFSDSSGGIIDIVLQIMSDGYLFWTDTFQVDVVTAIEDGKSKIPAKFALRQNYPNPFNPTTTISYQLPKQSNVELNIYNLLGQKVATLVSKKQPAGSHKVEWDATGFASGVYLYKLSTDQGFTKIKKLILLK